LIVATTMLGALVISIVVPHNQLSLISGVFEGFKMFLTQFHMDWALDIIVLALIVGGLSMTSSWLIGPARGLATAAQEGLFPRWLGKENKHGMPINVLITQGIIGSFISTIFLFASSLSAAFWMLMVLTSQFTLVLDILIFASVIKLRYSEPTTIRTFKIPGKNFGVWLIAGLSIVSCMAAIILGFVPPSNLNVGSTANFEMILIIGNICYIAIPYLIHRYSKKDICRAE
jgi:glutamate:GABA antiporter